MTGLEPVSLFITNEVLYRLSYISVTDIIIDYFSIYCKYYFEIKPTPWA